MSYFCFLCNDNHEDSPTEEHFIPRSIDGPQYQWLPVCEASNTRSNSIFDNDARDILYWVRYQQTQALKRSGEALLADGTLKPFRFSYHEDSVPVGNTAFQYIYDRDENSHIPRELVYAIAFPVGLCPNEQLMYCRGLAKISLGALVYLLKQQGWEDQLIKQIFSQESINVIRLFALDLPRLGSSIAMRFSLAQSNVLERLQCTCEDHLIRNHVISVTFKDKNTIHIEGMLYSQYSWVLDLTNQVPSGEFELRLENQISHMNAPESLRDMTLSADAICIINPDFKGQKPNIPEHWSNT